jgi:hypothetical protein
VWRVVFTIGVKALFDGRLGGEAARERNRAETLIKLPRRLDR